MIMSSAISQVLATYGQQLFIIYISNTEKNILFMAFMPHETISPLDNTLGITQCYSLTFSISVGYKV